VRAAMMYDTHPNRSPDFELVYLVLAHGSPGDMEPDTRDFVRNQLMIVARNIPKTKVRLVWQWVPLV
jgi:hypothetical protein